MKKNEAAKQNAPKTEAKTEQAPAPANAGGKPGREKKFADGLVITVLKGNPKRKGTSAYARYALYKTGQTVAEAIKAGVRRADLSWDARHGFVEIK